MAIKKDSDKSRVDLINPKFIEDIGNALGYGASKYSDLNYREGEGLDHNRLYASAMRHLLRYAKGETFDDESMVHHLVAVAVNCMMIYTLEDLEIGNEFDYWTYHEKQKYTERTERCSNRQTKKKSKKTGKRKCKA